MAVTWQALAVTSVGLGVQTDGSEDRWLQSLGISIMTNYSCLSCFLGGVVVVTQLRYRNAHCWGWEAWLEWGGVSALLASG